MATIKHDHIVEECWHVLENAGFHITSERRERRFLTAYQVYDILAQEGNPLCQELIDEVNGDHRGKGGGAHQHDGQVKRIAQALGGHPEVETQYIDTRHLKIDGIQPSSKEDCGIFRLGN
jgi:hypothetical protein